MLQAVLAAGMTVFALDTAGSGHSDGEYVTLGWNEKDDLACVIEYLRELGSVSTIGLWGRSMGAATSLLHSHRDASIAGMVLDSAFSDLRVLVDELVVQAKDNGLQVPDLLLKAAFKMVKSSVYRKSGLVIEELKPVQDVDKAFVPALFGHGEEDVFIDVSHSRALHHAYAGDSKLITFEGDHNSERPDFFIDSAVIFLTNYLQVPSSYAVDITGRPQLSPGEEVRPWTNGYSSLMMDSLAHMGVGSQGDDGYVHIGEQVTDDDLLQQALQLSLQEAQPTRAGSSPTDRSTRMARGQEAAQQSLVALHGLEGLAHITNDPGADMTGMTDEEVLQQVLQLSLLEAQEAGHVPVDLGPAIDTPALDEGEQGSDTGTSKA
eukprot:TRINITY_DN8361_c0_g1_i2.p1 TRINITY_DN8361_c0_g1~~TRINITY_DN8361_c0_g1_i2.p1  ORF type:complete len:377 (+),score=60.92 TRINITY_DN8361_c0_g1_i2:260-1390(+)